MQAKKEVEPEQEQPYAVINDEPAESWKIACPMKIRDKVQEDIARFRSKGRAISEIDSEVTGGPPGKLESPHYLVLAMSWSPSSLARDFQ
jgi:hypothetical protein